MVGRVRRNPMGGVALKPAAAASPSLEAGLLGASPRVGGCRMRAPGLDGHRVGQGASAATRRIPQHRGHVPAMLALGSRPGAAQYLYMLRNAGVRQRTKVAKGTEDRSRAALQSVDADSIELIFKTMERTYKPTAFPYGDVDAQVARPLQTSGSSLAAPAPSGRAPPKEHVRGTTQWMKFICPGAGKVEGVGEIAVKKWVDLIDSLKPSFRQQTRSQRWRKDDTQTGQLTCHQALSHVKWQWAKHMELTEQEVHPSPTSVGCAGNSISMSQVPMQYWEYTRYVVNTCKVF